AGGCFAALIPASLVYVGDTWPAHVRQRPLSDVLAASALGTAAATAGAGLLADLVSWRAVFGMTAVAGGALWSALARLPEPELEPVSGNPLRPLGRVLRVRWAWVVLLLAFVEGVVVLGALTYLAPALQSLGSSAAVAGLVSGGFGVGALLFSRVVRLLVGRVPPAGLAGIGGGFLAAAWAAPAITVTVPTVLIAGLLLGGSWAFLHSTLQSWATDVVPQARAAAVALFATVLFLGSSAGTAIAAPAADDGAFGLLFRTAFMVAVPLAVVAVLARARYDRRRPRTAMEPADGSRHRPEVPSVGVTVQSVHMVDHGSGRVALVTGGSRGIGAEIARRLAGEGFALTVAARQEAGVTAVVEQLRAEFGVEVLGVVANMAKDEDVARLAAAHEERFGRLDLLVLGAGMGIDEPVAAVRPKAYDLQLAVNLRAPVLLVSQLLPLLRSTAKANPAAGARVVALASITGVAGEAGLAVYGASKAALISFCETLSLEESAGGVSATAVAPGYVDTDMTEHLRDRLDRSAMLTVDDVAELVLSLTRLSAAAVVPTMVVTRAGPQMWRA
ncbi:SDR family NAD(P)-dependent oxidoreductase, partial [Pseudonocardia bannensis]